MTLTVGSLFSGIGGLDLGLERAGMRVVWQSEIDKYATRVLAKHWPEVPNYGDIKLIDWRTVESVDVICGGYPCQPFSTAGKRRGSDDPRHLWPWVQDAISALRPRYAILENVRGHLSMGGTTVVGELAEIGYSAEWRVISAAGMGAPHRRDRVLIVAYPDDTRERAPKRSMERARSANFARGNESRDESRGRGSVLADSDGGRCKQRKSETESLSWTSSSREREREVFSRRNHDQATEPYDGWKWWETEPDVGRVANGIPARVDRLRALGNAVVPHVAEYVGRLVMIDYEESRKGDQ